MTFFGAGANHGVFKIGKIQGARPQEGGLLGRDDGEILQQPVNDFIGLGAIGIFGHEIN